MKVVSMERVKGHVLLLGLSPIWMVSPVRSKLPSIAKGIDLACRRLPRLFRLHERCMTCQARRREYCTHCPESLFALRRGLSLLFRIVHLTALALVLVLDGFLIGVCQHVLVP